MASQNVGFARSGPAARASSPLGDVARRELNGELFLEGCRLPARYLTFVILSAAEDRLSDCRFGSSGARTEEEWAQVDLLTRQTHILTDLTPCPLAIEDGPHGTAGSAIAEDQVFED